MEIFGLKISRIKKEPKKQSPKLSQFLVICKDNMGGPLDLGEAICVSSVNYSENHIIEEWIYNKELPIIYIIPYKYVPTHYREWKKNLTESSLRDLMDARIIKESLR